MEFSNNLFLDTFSNLQSAISFWAMYGFLEAHFSTKFNEQFWDNKYKDIIWPYFWVVLVQTSICGEGMQRAFLWHIWYLIKVLDYSREMDELFSEKELIPPGKSKKRFPPGNSTFCKQGTDATTDTKIKWKFWVFLMLNNLPNINLVFMGGNLQKWNKLEFLERVVLLATITIETDSITIEMLRSPYHIIGSLNFF